jgi:hypothetical protein
MVRIKNCMSKHSEKFKSRLHKTTIRGWINQKTSHEDNIIYIQDMSTFVAENYKKNKFIIANTKFKDFDFTASPGPGPGAGAGARNIFLGVFDGHGGKIASEFSSETAVYELFAMPEYQQGHYEKALKKLFINIHNSLLNSPYYKCENNLPFGSGSTASVALITPEWTFFASVGNTTILVCNVKKVVYHLGACHNRLNDDCVKNITESGIPVIRESSESRDSRHEETCISIGGGLTFYGGIGDSLYDPTVFNAMISLMKKFYKENKIKKYMLEDSLVEKFASYVKSSSTMTSSTTTLNFQCRPKFKFYSSILKACESDITAPNLLKKDPIIRRPFVKSIRNRHLAAFAIVSNAVIESKMPYSKEPIIESLIFNETRGFDEGFKECSSLSQPPHSDDRSGFLCWFDSPVAPAPVRQNKKSSRTISLKKKPMSIPIRLRIT